MQVPPQLNYNQLQTKAFFSVYKQWPIEPISNGGQYYPGQVIRIFFNALTDGVFDPYRSHIQITVSCDSSTLPVGLLQVDNSAQSFIQQIVISSKNRQIERIVQYGVLAAYLTDMGISQIYTQGKQVEGLGYSNIDNYSTMYSHSTTPSYSAFIDDWSAQGQQNRAMISTGGILPTIPTKSPLSYAYGTQVTAQSLMSGVFRGHTSWLNTAWISLSQNPWWWYVYTNGDVTAPTIPPTPRTCNLDYYGYNNNLRAEYIASHVANDYIDSTTSYGKSQILLDPSVQQSTFPAKFQNGTVYTTYISDSVGYYSQAVDTVSVPDVAARIPNVSSLTGFTNLYSPNFAKGVREPFISPTVPQCQMANGLILPQKIAISRRTFKIPLISAVMGLLIPQSQFVLLPLKALNDMLIQMTIDNFAMFTSGYNDISQFDNVGMGLMQKRAFTIERLVYNLHTYQFYNPQMDQYLRISLTTGIAINTKFWQMGNQYQIQNSQSITNSWPVACNQQALNEILTLFVPLDYQNMSFCRKHFRLSNNVTKMQLRINMQYYPSQPLTGNGGNPIQMDMTGNNGIFLQQLYMAHDHTFNKKPNPRINNFNFAINDRCYDIFNTHTLYDPAMIDDPLYVWGQFSVNHETAMGMPNLHQNRYVGKAAYLFSFEPYSHSKQFLTGIDCRSAKAFDIIFTCNPQNWFPRPQTMYIYTCSSVIIEYGKDGIVNINK